MRFYCRAKRAPTCGDLVQWNMCPAAISDNARPLGPAAFKMPVLINALVFHGAQVAETWRSGLSVVDEWHLFTENTSTPMIGVLIRCKSGASNALRFMFALWFHTCRVVRFIRTRSIRRAGFKRLFNLIWIVWIESTRVIDVARA